MLILLLLLLIYGILFINCTTQKNKFIPEFKKLSEANSSTSTFADFKYFLNPNAEEFNPLHDQLNNYQANYSFELFNQMFSINNSNYLCAEETFNFSLFGQNTNSWEFNFPIFEGINQNIVEQEFIVNFNPEWIIENISKHFDEIGWPEEEKYLTDNKNYLIKINLLTMKTEWILKIINPNNQLITENIKLDFGHLKNKKMLKIIELLNKYENCIANWNNKTIITLTGPISIITKVTSEEIKLKGNVKSYLFNNIIKYPPISQFFKLIIIEYENKKYCADIIFTKAEWNIETNFDEINKNNNYLICSDEHLFNNKIKNLPSINKEKNIKKYNKSNIRIYQDFIINFNRKKQIPNWVLEYLNKEELNKLKPNERYYWINDPDFSEIFQPKYEDYDCPQRFDINHGHLAPAFLHPFQQGYYLTNSVPQYDKINKGHWRVIEEYISCLARSVEETFIYTGPLFLPNEKTNLMEFQVLGPKEIFVPTHLFKIVLLKIFENNNWKYWLESYVITNINLDDLFNEKLDNLTNPYKNDGSPEIIQNCRRDLYSFEYSKDKIYYINDLLNYYRKPYKFIEENVEFKLLNKINENIKKLKDVQIFDLEIETKSREESEGELNKNKKEEEKIKVEDIKNIPKTKKLNKTKNKNKLEKKEEDEDIKLLNEIIKQNKLEIEEKEKKAKEALELKIKKNLEIERKERKKEKRKLKKQTKLNKENNLIIYLPVDNNENLNSLGNNYNFYNNIGNNILKHIDVFYKEKTLEKYCLIDKMIVQYFHSVAKYFTLIYKKFENVSTNWRFDGSYYDQLVNYREIINKENKNNLKTHKMIEEFVVKFLYFYQITFNDLVNLVGSNLDKALAIVFNEQQIPEKIIPIYDILEELFNNHPQKYLISELIIIKKNIKDDKLIKLIEIMYLIIFHSSLLDKLIQLFLKIRFILKYINQLFQLIKLFGIENNNEIEISTFVMKIN
ncbi:hypothetical protein Mgra_00003713 [Meloidogyne graminicola]|uniref:DNA/RNA non-specific endonuclease n=1 Tax=Meloidogyne graminicola TaxID=189291 RepID=A0A8S9ZU98_9BILA|nr:hypothetical protein Mgra_00003713 [Meloidogyne graminicola]